MQIISIAIAEIQPGKFKAIIWGQHDDHVMDWNGCNYRYMVVKGQPRSGFANAVEVSDWWGNQSSEHKASEMERAFFIGGIHIGPYAKYPALGENLS
jgi:hypothetical protein